RYQSRDHAAVANTTLIANFTPELPGVMASLFPAPLQIIAKVLHTGCLPLRLAALGESTGSQKAPDRFSLDASCLAVRRHGGLARRLYNDQYHVPCLLDPLQPKF